MKPTLDKYGIDFVAVGLHTHLAEDFLAKTGFEGQLVINKKKDVWTGIKQAGYLALLNPSIMIKAMTSGLGGTMEPIDGFQLGGLVVIDQLPKGEIVYQWEQPAMGVYPPVDEVLKAATEGMESVKLGKGKTCEDKAAGDNTKKTAVLSRPTDAEVDSLTEKVKAM